MTGNRALEIVATARAYAGNRDEHVRLFQRDHDRRTAIRLRRAAGKRRRFGFDHEHRWSEQQHRMDWPLVRARSSHAFDRTKDVTTKSLNLDWCHWTKSRSFAIQSRRLRTPSALSSLRAVDFRIRSPRLTRLTTVCVTFATFATARMAGAKSELMGIRE